jgi:hypothetical protein
MANLPQDLIDRGLWLSAVRNQLMRDGGLVAKIEAIPARLKDLYKTVWEIKMKVSSTWLLTEESSLIKARA